MGTKKGQVRKTARRAYMPKKKLRKKKSRVTKKKAKRERSKRAVAGLRFMVREAKEGYFNVDDFEDLGARS